jgi:hypothetical protein
MGSYASDKAWFKIYMDLKDYDRAGAYARKLIALTNDRKLNKLIMSNCYENAIRFFSGRKARDDSHFAVGRGPSPLCPRHFG